MACGIVFFSYCAPFLTKKSMMRVLIKVWIVVNNRGQVLKQWAFYSQTVFFKIFILRVLIKKKLFLPLRTDFCGELCTFY